jgi:hypothetical protein
MVKLHEALLYKDEEQERLARSLTKAVIETACNARNYDMILLIISVENVRYLAMVRLNVVINR